MGAAAIVREEVLELCELECTYVQIDAPEIAIIGVDEDYWQNLVELTELPAHRILDEAVDVLNGIGVGVPIAAALLSAVATTAVVGQLRAAMTRSPTGRCHA
jgi:methionine synthase II (cobalamin-independent)